MNILFVAKHSFLRHSEVKKQKLPTEISEESFLVAGAGLEPTSASWRI